MDLETLRLFVVSKLGWIRKQQTRLAVQERETPREFIDRESHFVWGRRCLLEIVDTDTAPRVELRHRTLVLQIRPGTPLATRRAIVDAWYREELKDAARILAMKWEPRIGVVARKVLVQRMRTRWGTCNPRTRSIRLNTELAKKPLECLEYVVVHELVHLLERRHNARFRSLMTTLLPGWAHHRQLLNSLPVAHEDWNR